MGTVLFDASEQGQLDNDHHNAWGISFFNTPDTPPTLRITQIEINLRATPGTIGSFVAPVSLSDNVPPYAVRCPGQGNDPDIEQPDIEGFANPAAQIAFSIGGPGNSVLTITFSPFGGDDGFAPCDRFRFGVLVANVATLNQTGDDNNDGDGIGADTVGVKVYFNSGEIAEGNFTDTIDRKNECCDPPTIDPACGSLVVHPTGIPDLPCPPGSAPGNNGQSYVLLQGGSGRRFAVRAQAVVRVPSLFTAIGGDHCGPYCISARATAVYDCEDRRPSLVRVDRYLCPGTPTP